MDLYDRIIKAQKMGLLNPEQIALIIVELSNGTYSNTLDRVLGQAQGRAA